MCACLLSAIPVRDFIESRITRRVSHRQPLTVDWKLRAHGGWLEPMVGRSHREVLTSFTRSVSIQTTWSRLGRSSIWPKSSNPRIVYRRPTKLLKSSSVLMSSIWGSRGSEPSSGREGAGTESLGDARGWYGADLWPSERKDRPKPGSSGGIGASARRRCRGTGPSLRWRTRWRVLARWRSNRSGRGPSRPPW